MGAPRDAHENAAGLELARLLRSWWEEDPGNITQQALARRLTERDVRISQEMLSRYLHRTTPRLARPDVIRTMHELLGRAPEELTKALALHAAARTGESPVPGPRSVHTPTVRTKRWPWIAVAALTAAVAAGLTAAWTLGSEEDPGSGEQPTASALSSSPSPSPSRALTKCRGESCYGIDPQHSTCREDAATYYRGGTEGMVVELRFSPACQAAWAKMSGTSQGDVVRVKNKKGDTRHYTQQWGYDAHTTMVEALNPDGVQACAVLTGGTVCATTPADLGATRSPG
ncbi:DUF2690 domain-containing protein [Streptomyces sp. CA-210063]|uniref:DUF2690 domain-containing protein n=1 Tax=Streptomyces sp. CA-210063 TaxID=2801029 RepID=UPI00214CEC47|nr:DUF2690 domain-containing protein [Streptomyces sp. CA-210063]UUU31847.1 DUF2690 domain-containing protein [Streptomyces sp. CA-210063]